ncbi:MULTISPECIES: type II toxin-antitoxin system VapB family antitoxin [unclassified Synechococcus]|uniref:type II toxin-antitoxin system VapC family toxin n=1 Tax=unclassified Synechococcus TaxID=2626047 RepID=UPI0000699055|nr:MULTISPECIES: type II toxin-antitoxin system VapB family antitoxin [unclassified Synechococcus]EAQ74237.1 hypothetical protein WH5701_06386 [Synechococcus sp. WH 5701]WFN60030.1 type II toxin-antitoxin system VapB family antitoxin [Synechococcus sp. CCFWC 502]
MRTNIVIDDQLMRDAMQASGARTKREAFEIGLRTLVRLEQQKRIQAFRGRLSRGGRPGEPPPGPVPCRGRGSVTVVDSSVWIDFFNGVSTPEVERLDGLLGSTPVAIGDLILVKVLQGFRHDRDVATARQLFRAMPLLTMLGPQNAYKAAGNYRSLHSRGITVRKTIDGIIATACIQATVPLLFSDRDFQPYVDHLGLEAA